MSDSIRESVSEYLKSIGVKVSFHYAGERTRDDWKHDKWIITFTSTKGESDFDYRTGLGHRAGPTAADKAHIKWSFSGLTEQDIKARTSYGRQYLQAVENSRKPQAPDPAGVLHCLILDMQAEHMTFNEWCENFGYSNDSIKAESIFDACRQQARELRAVFTIEQIRQIEELTQDY